jgi:hypothetical protein
LWARSGRRQLCHGWQPLGAAGDNLRVMKDKLGDGIADLIYLDPPFKSDINYNMLFTADGLHPDEAQMGARLEVRFTNA